MNSTRLKLAKNEAKAKQHPEDELLLFENYLFSSFMVSSKSSKTNMKHPKKCVNKECICFNQII